MVLAILFFLDDMLNHTKGAEWPFAGNAKGDECPWLAWRGANQANNRYRI